MDTYRKQSIKSIYRIVKKYKQMRTEPENLRRRLKSVSSRRGGSFRNKTSVLITLFELGNLFAFAAFIFFSLCFNAIQCYTNV